jgi:hypothetical protein
MAKNQHFKLSDLVYQFYSIFTLFHISEASEGLAAFLSATVVLPE